MNATDTDDDEPAILFPALASDVGSPLIPASMVCGFLSILLSVICIVLIAWGFVSPVLAQRRQGSEIV
jgi:hypothetical protein